MVRGTSEVHAEELGSRVRRACVARLSCDQSEARGESGTMERFPSAERLESGMMERCRTIVGPPLRTDQAMVPAS